METQIVDAETYETYHTYTEDRDFVGICRLYAEYGYNVFAVRGHDAIATVDGEF